MSVYFDKARELGKLLLNSEHSLRLSDADAAFQANQAAKAKMDAFHVFQNDVQERLNKGAMSDDEFNTANTRLSEMASEIKRDPVIGALIHAENEYNFFVGQVFNVIRATLNGSSDLTDSLSCGSIKHCHGCH